MNAPASVQIGFDLSAVGSPTLFTLNDPVQGQLDSEYVLGGEIYEDVTTYVRGISIRRGRSRRLDRFQTGTATVMFDNRSRAFDPSYTSSPYAGNIKPRRPIIISVGNEFLFTGLIEDWNLEYDLTGDSQAVAACVDGFVLLAGAELAAHTASAQSSGERVSAVLDRTEVSWPAGARDIATGSQALQADTVDSGTNVLSYLEKVQQTESGALFIDADGVLTFRGSNTPSAAIRPVVFTNVLNDPDLSGYTDPDTSYNDPVVDYSKPGIPGTLIPFREIAVEYGTETLFNRVTLSRDGSSTVATANDLTSQAEFGVATLSADNLLFASDDQLEPMSSFLVNRYGTPQVRIRQIGLDITNNPEASTLLDLEFGDVVRCRFKPNGIGEPIDQYLTVEGIEHEVTHLIHRMRFQFGLITYFPFELGSSDYGILDTNVLGL